MKTMVTLAAGTVGAMVATAALAAPAVLTFQETPVQPNPMQVGYNPQPCNPANYGFCFPLDPTNLNMVYLGRDEKRRQTWYTEAGHSNNMFDLIRVDDYQDPTCLGMSGTGVDCPVQNVTVLFFNVDCNTHRFYQAAAAEGANKTDINGTTRMVQVGGTFTTPLGNRWLFDGPHPAQVRAKQVCAELMMR